LTAGDRSMAQLFNADTGEPRQSFAHTEPAAVWAALFHPDGKHVVTACDDRKARVWDMAAPTRRCVRCRTCTSSAAWRSVTTAAASPPPATTARRASGTREAASR